MKRRDFLRINTMAAAVVPLVPVVVGAFGWAVDEQPVLRPSVHVLGPTPTRSGARAAKMLSDDVFARLCEELRGRSFVVTPGERLGGSGVRFGGEVVTLTHIWNHGYELAPEYLADQPPVFDVEEFRRDTNRWGRGHYLQLRPGRDGVSATEAMSGLRIVGMPPLPLGVVWAAHYVDDTSGVVMRAIGVYELARDSIIVRWDVLCG